MFGGAVGMAVLLAARGPEWDGNQDASSHCDSALCPHKHPCLHYARVYKQINLLIL